MSTSSPAEKHKMCFCERREKKTEELWKKNKPCYVDVLKRDINNKWERPLFHKRRQRSFSRRDEKEGFILKKDQWGKNKTTVLSTC